MVQILPCHILWCGIGTHINAAHIFPYKAQYDQNSAPQQEQQRRGGRPPQRGSVTDKMIDHNVNQIQEPAIADNVPK